MLKNMQDNSYKSYAPQKQLGSRSGLENQFNNNYAENFPDGEDIDRRENNNSEIEEPLEQFFNEEFLSDCLIIDSLSSKIIRSHCILLACHSDLFKSHFQKYHEIILNGTLKNPHKIKLPIPISIKCQNIQSDIFEKCMNYFYSSNNFELLLKNGFSNNNCFWFYSYFHSLGHQSALFQIENAILHSIVNPMNVISFLIEALKFRSVKIVHKSLEIIETNFDKLIQGKDNCMKIRELPSDIFKEILSSNYLQINKEDIILQIIIDYINFREHEPELPSKSLTESNINDKKLEENKANDDKKIDKIEENKANHDKKPDDKNPEDKKPDDKKPDDKKMEDKKPEDKKPEEKKPDEKKIEEKKGEDKGPPVNLKSGEKEQQKSIADAGKKQDGHEEGTYLLGELEDLNELTKDLFHLHKLSPEEKIDLLACCRLSYVEHDLLLKVSNLPSVAEFKNIFIEAISAKLLNYENASHTYSINLYPRESYREAIENQRYYSNQSSVKIQNEDHGENLNNQKQAINNQSQISNKKVPINSEKERYELNKNQENIQYNQNTNSNIYKSNQKTPLQQPSNYQQQPSSQINVSKNSSIQNYPQPQSNNLSNQQNEQQRDIEDSQFNQNTNSHFYKSTQNQISNLYNSQQPQSKNQSDSNLYSKKNPYQNQLESSPPSGLKNQQVQQVYTDPSSQNRYPNLSKSQEVQTNYNLQDYPQKMLNTSPKGFIEKSEIQKQIANNREYNQSPKINDQSNFNTYNNAGEIDERFSGKIKQPSYRYEDITKVKTAQSLSPLEFIYKYDFDDNGIFYYLGSFGKTKNWVNPHLLKLVEVNFSSLGTGAKIEDFIGRECVNCCTKNEKNAFMSVDIGEGRIFFPSCYTLRNRPSKKYVLMNWILEGSVNNNEFYIIDKRINLTEDSHFNSLMEKEREELMQKGQTSTWGIDAENIECILNEFNHKSKIEIRGFRYFRITQLMKNSDGDYNLCLSGFELYGTGYGTKWYF